MSSLRNIGTSYNVTTTSSVRPTPLKHCRYDVVSLFVNCLSHFNFLLHVKALKVGIITFVYRVYSNTHILPQIHIYIFMLVRVREARRGLKKCLKKIF